MRSIAFVFALFMFLCGCSEYGEIVAVSASPVATAFTPTYAVPVHSPEPTPVTDLRDEYGDWDWFATPIHPDLLPLIVYEFPPSSREAAAKPAHPNPAELRFDANDKDFFLPDDVMAGDLRVGMTQDAVLGLLGLPQVVHAFINDMYAFQYLELWYANGDHFTFWNINGDEYTLFNMNIVSNAQGPRGLKVGDSMQAVLDAFRIDSTFMEGASREEGPILYAGAPYPPDADCPFPDHLLPPSGTIDWPGYRQRELTAPDKLCIRYEYPETIYTYQDLAENDYYLYQFLFYCYFYISDGHVAYYRLGFG